MVPSVMLYEVPVVLVSVLNAKVAFILLITPLADVSILLMLMVPVEAGLFALFLLYIK